MNYILKYKNENKWIDSRLDTIKEYEIELINRLLNFPNIEERHKVLFSTWLDKLNLLIKDKIAVHTIGQKTYNCFFSKSMSNYYFIFIPRNSVTRISKAVNYNHNNLDKLKSMLTQYMDFLSVNEKVKLVLPKYQNLFEKIQGSHITIKGGFELIPIFGSAITSLSAMKKNPLLMNKVDFEKRDIDSKYISSIGYVVFKENKGFIDKNGLSVGLSSARLYDSDIGAKRNLSFLNYEVVQVEIKLKKRITNNPNIGDDLVNAFVTLEKEKIEKFFEENDLEVIQKKLNELKEKKERILLLKDSNLNENKEVEDTEPKLKKRNKI